MTQYIYLDDKELEIIKKIEEMTFTGYECKGNFLPLDSIIPIFQDLLNEIDKRDEEIEDIKNDMESNYRPLTNRELYGD